MRTLWSEATCRPAEYTLPDAFLYLNAWVSRRNYREQMLKNPEENLLQLGLLSAAQYMKDHPDVPGTLCLDRFFRH